MQTQTGLDKLARSKSDDSKFSIHDAYTLEKISKENLRELYPIISARRLQWDNLLWQVPLISITGESFLLTIILSGATSPGARILSSVLGMILAYASITTLSRHRISEVHDANVVEAIERKLFGMAFHGANFSKNRKSLLNKMTATNKVEGKSGFWDALLRITNRGRAYPIWMFVFISFFIVSAVCIILTIADPGFFASR